MEYKSILFDFDFTLADASEGIIAGFQHAFPVMGHPIPSSDAVRHTIGLPLEDSYTLLTGDEVEERRATFRRHFTQVAGPTQIETTRMFPGAAELLQALQGAGIPAAIVSTKRASTLRDVLGARNLLSLFASITGGEMVSQQKPAPEGLLSAISSLGLTPGQVLYCGDTVIDAEAAQRAGAHFAAVLNGTTTAQAFEAFPYDHIAPNLNELRVWLGL